MAEFDVEARISYKPGVLDAEGETIQKSLGLLGFDVEKVESIKVYKITVKADSINGALSQVDDCCDKLLANAVIQDYEIKAV